MNDRAAILQAPFMPSGMVRDLPFDEYRRVEALSASGAKKLRRSPLHYLLERTSPSEPTDAMLFGTAVHTGVLEPHRFELDVVEAPDVNRRTNAGREEWAAFQAANARRVILSPKDMARARRCIDAVRSHPAAAALLDGAEVEVSAFWTHPRHGVPYKCRFDVLNAGILGDVKTTDDASLDAFQRTIAAFEYHGQAAHYCDGHAATADGVMPDGFCFIAVERDEPHAVAVYQLDAPSLLAGARLMEIAAERYAEALRSGAWRGYSEQIQRINVPRWALRADV